MPLTGHLSDLSLSELIEFFCNQRKLGLLSVHYPQGSGAFYLQNGSVVDAKLGSLRGIDAVYYALTLPNAAFEFKGATEATERTINQPWTQVVLEGLRRLDEGIVPAEAFPDAPLVREIESQETTAKDVAEPAATSNEHSGVPAFLSLLPATANRRKPIIVGLAAVAVLVSVAAVGVPAGWYGRSKAPAAAAQPGNLQAAAPQPAEVKQSANEPQAAAVDPRAAESAALAAKRQREKDRARAREEKANAPATDSEKATASAKPTPAGNTENKSGQKKVTVQVSYDESGRVVQASGADPTALRIARQKRFPAGKAGTATVTIPLN